MESLNANNNEDQADCSQGAVGHKGSRRGLLRDEFAGVNGRGGRAFSLRGAGWRTGPAGVQKAVFEGPVLSQIVPAVILLLPAIVTKPAYHCRGKGLRIERRNPEPFVFRGFRRKFAPAVAILCKRLFRAHDADGLRVIG